MAAAQIDGLEPEEIWHAYPDGLLPPQWLELALASENPFPPPDPGFRSNNWIGGLRSVHQYRAWHGGYRSPASWFRGAPPRTLADDCSVLESPHSCSSSRAASDASTLLQRPQSARAVAALASHNIAMGVVIAPPQAPRQRRAPATSLAVRQRPLSAATAFSQKTQNSEAVIQAHAAAWTVCESPSLDSRKSISSSHAVRQRPWSAAATFSRKTQNSETASQAQAACESQSTNFSAVRQRPWSAAATFCRKTENSEAASQAQAIALSRGGCQREVCESQSPGFRKSTNSPLGQCGPISSPQIESPPPVQFESPPPTVEPRDTLRKSLKEHGDLLAKGRRRSLKSLSKGLVMMDSGAIGNNARASIAGRLNVGKPHQSRAPTKRISRKVAELHKLLNSYKITRRRRGRAGSSGSESESELTSDIVSGLREMFHHDVHNGDSDVASEKKEQENDPEPPEIDKVNK